MWRAIPGNYSASRGPGCGASLARLRAHRVATSRRRLWRSGNFRPAKERSPPDNCVHEGGGSAALSPLHPRPPSAVRCRGEPNARPLEDEHPPAGRRSLAASADRVRDRAGYTEISRPYSLAVCRRRKDPRSSSAATSRTASQRGRAIVLRWLRGCLLGKSGSISRLRPASCLPQLPTEHQSCPLRRRPDVAGNFPLAGPAPQRVLNTRRARSRARGRGNFTAGGGLVWLAQAAALPTPLVAPSLDGTNLLCD